MACRLCRSRRALLIPMVCVAALLGGAGAGLGQTVTLESVEVSASPLSGAGAPSAASEGTVAPEALEARPA
jgi:hypothetical protein